MHPVDYVVLIIYFAAVIALGFWFKNKAAKDLESYFLGGRSVRWLILAMSGSVSNFDITGTMWIVSIIVLLGMKSMWHHWMWGFLMGAFFMSYMGKWVRRSGVLTAAEWMKTRFGDDTAGIAARTAYALLGIVTLASFIGYAYQGIGTFGRVVLGIQPQYESLCALLIIGATTLYVLLGGLYGVVFTQFLQTIILTFSSIIIAVIAYINLTPEVLADLPENFMSIAPVWRINDPSIPAKFHLFGALVIVWCIKGLLLNAGGPAQMYDFQIFLASKGPRDAAKVGAAWSAFLIVRWAMCMGIALLAITAMGGAQNIESAEEAMPKVLQTFLPPVLKGIVIAGLLAAFMSTFSATVNCAASFIVRDFWQRFVKPDASQNHLVLASRIATVAVVSVGLFMGTQVKSIAQIWDWIMMVLGTGVVAPNMLRWYWWRINGWGFAAGTVTGVALSLAVFIYDAASAGPPTPVYVVFPPVFLSSLAATIIVSLITRPVKDTTLVRFFTTVRPFGWWKTIRQKSGLSEQELNKKSERTSLMLFNTFIAMITITGLYLFPMYLVAHQYTYFLVCLVFAVAGIIVLRYTWYENLPATEPQTNSGQNEHLESAKSQ